MPSEPRELSPREQAAVLGLRLRCALERMFPLAEAGNDRAQYRLGRRFTSWGDDVTAASWYRRAAELGNARAWLALARIAERDIEARDDVEAVRDEEGAVDLFRNEATRGDPQSAREGVEERRRTLMQHAREPGRESSSVRPGRILYHHSRAPRPELLRAAELGYYEAQRELGDWFAREALAARAVDTPEAAADFARLWPEACRWYARAAEQGDARSQDDCGWLMLFCEGIAVADAAAALAYLERSAASGHLLALAHLALIYRDGFAGIAADPAKMRHWRERLQHFTDLAKTGASAPRTRPVTWRSLNEEERELVEELPQRKTYRRSLME